jgi:DNA repair protein RadC
MHQGREPEVPAPTPGLCTRSSGRRARRSVHHAQGGVMSSTSAHAQQPALDPVESPAQARGGLSIHVPVYCIQLERTGSILSRAGKCTTARDAAQLVRKYIGDPDREHFVAIYLDPQFVVLGVQTISIGGISSVSVTASEVFKGAMLCNATGVTVVHNHPAGRAKPSKADCILTGELEIAGVFVGVQVIDHVVLGTDDSCSMREQDMMLIPITCEFEADRFLKDTARRTRRGGQRSKP